MPKNSFVLRTVIFTILFLSLFLNFCLPQDKIVAIVNNDIITQKDLNDFINFMRMQLSVNLKGKELESEIQSMKLDLLDKLIEDRLILQEAKKDNIKVDEDVVRKRVEEIKEKYRSDREFQDALAQQGLVQADIELRIREQLLMYNIINIKIRSKIMINPGEVTDFYQKNIKEFKVPEQREIESITVDDKNLIGQMQGDLKNGLDFSDIAKKYSLRVNKFSIGHRQELIEDIGKVIFELNIGEASEPIKIQESFYIFKFVSIIPSRPQRLFEVQDRIYAFLFEKKMQEELTAWLNRLKEDSYIKIF